MPTRRMIDPSFWQSESMAELSEGERLFFIGLISNADDQGRIRGHPSLLRSLIYPFDDISTEVIEARIEALSSIDSIFIYETGGKKAIQIIKWWDYQSPQWAYPSKMEPPPGWSDRLRYRADNKVHQDNWAGPGGFIDRDSYDDYANLGKDLGNALPKELGNPIEVGLEVELNDNNSIESCSDDYGQICTLYENNISTITPIVAQDISAYLDECSPDWIIKAITIAAENNVRKWKYIKAILDRWIAAGQISDEPSKNGKDPVYSDIDNDQQAIMTIAEIIKVEMGGDGNAARRGRDLYYEHRDWDFQKIARAAIRAGP